MPQSIRIFESWKIDYCCGGRTPLSEACAEAGHTLDEFTAALDASPAVPVRGAEWQSSNLAEVARRIIVDYHHYTEASRGARAVVTPFFGTVKNPVKMMMMEHERVGELLERIRTVTANYNLPEVPARRLLTRKRRRAGRATGLLVATSKKR